MTGRRRLAIAYVVEALAFVAVAIVALDLYAHKRLDLLAGLNIRGYRGAVAHQKQPREIRFAVIGGARAFGFGMPASWTIATVMRQQVMLVTDRRGSEVRQVVALTIAFPGALPDSYASTLERYAYLAPDYICIYDDLGVGGAPSREETSGIFAHTGYWPMLPLALKEKGMSWRFGTVGAGYARTGPMPPQPDAIRRTAGAVVQAGGSALSALDRFGARPATPHPADDPERYAADVMRATGVALERARGVVVALAPAESRLQSSNLAAVLPRLTAKEATTPHLRVVNLEGEPLLTDPSQRLDGWNYGGDAIEAAAKAIVPAMLDLIMRFEPGFAPSR
jgi:hypothetical protein